MKKEEDPLSGSTSDAWVTHSRATLTERGMPTSTLYRCYGGGGGCCLAYLSNSASSSLRLLAKTLSLSSNIILFCRRDETKCRKQSPFGGSTLPFTLSLILACSAAVYVKKRSHFPDGVLLCFARLERTVRAMPPHSCQKPLCSLKSSPSTQATESQICCRDYRRAVEGLRECNDRCGHLEQRGGCYYELRRWYSFGSAERTAGKMKSSFAPMLTEQRTREGTSEKWHATKSALITQTQHALGSFLLFNST